MPEIRSLKKILRSRNTPHYRQAIVNDACIDLAAIRTAAKRIARFVDRTPILENQRLSKAAGCTILLKAEHLQKAGAFKARGAHNAVFETPEIEASRGFATHSSGNHGAALALAARNRGAHAVIVMPQTATAVKRRAVADYGAEIVDCEPSQQAREAKLAEVLERTASHFVHPYDDPRVICGQGTVGLEIAEQCAGSPPEAVIVPVGGGGLLAGVGVALAQLLPSCQLIAAEPAGADDAYRSFHGGSWQPQLEPNTIADGLRMSLGKLNFPLIRRHVHDIVTVSDDAISDAMKLVWQLTEHVIEPSAAVPIAAVLADPDRFAGRRIVVVTTGRNVDLDRLPWSASQAVAGRV